MKMLRNQRGGVMLFVTIVGAVITTAFAMFFSSIVLVESRATEGELAKTRAYWAEMGNFAYALSRISESKMCGSCLVSGGNVKDSDLAPVLQSYFSELNNYKTWTYADESTNYSITTIVTAAPDDNVLRATYSGWLMATSAYTESSLVAGLNGHLPQMELRLCVGLNNSGAKCGALNHNNGGNTTAYFSLNRLTDLAG